jgi:hypothetical protein
MDLTILHIDVRTRPEFLVRIAAQVDGEPLRVTLEREVVEHLVGSGVGDDDAILQSLYHDLDTIRIAIEAHVFARGVPLDREVVLSWPEFSPAALTVEGAGSSLR